MVSQVLSMRAAVAHILECKLSAVIVILKKKENEHEIVEG
jgi:hypothetical protein